MRDRSINYKLNILIKRKEKYKTFGDTLLNFLYSYHYYLTKNKVVGKRVKNEDLQKVLKKVCPSIKFKDKKMAGDMVEALLAFCFLNKKITMEDLLKMCEDRNFLESLITSCVDLI